MTSDPGNPGASVTSPAGTSKGQAMATYDGNGFVTALDPGEVFVFGSNSQGLHAGGAARLAHQRFGAQWGVGAGRTGQCYAIPTMGGWNEFTAHAARFLADAQAAPGTTFLLTKVGCGIAGYPEAQVKQLFADAPANVVRPEGW